MYKDKLIKGIDENVYKHFLKYCKKHSTNVGEGITRVLAKHLRSKNINVSTSVLYTWEMLEEDVKNIISYIKNRDIKVTAIYGIPRGGLLLATMLSHELDLKTADVLYELPKKVDKGILIVDDISDTGTRLLSIPNIGEYNTITLAVKHKTGYMPSYNCRTFLPGEWVVFPWESLNSPKVKDNPTEKQNEKN